jgi:hypothetical protein
MKKILVLLILSFTAIAGLPPPSTKFNGDTSYKGTFQTDYGTIPATRNGAQVTIGTIPLSAGGTGSSTQNFVDLTTNQAVAGDKTLTGSTIIGNAGSESAGIDVGGTNYQSTFKVSDINGTNFAQTILHRHSTVLEPLILGARSNSDTSSHADVTAGQNLFSIYGSGSAGTNYKLFGGVNIAASSLGTISDTSAPGKIVLSTTPNAATGPTATLTLDSDKSATFAGTVSGTQYTSTITTGTAPLVVASTTKVDNLHVARATLADTVTTNANLTGDVTSTGNATTYNNVVPTTKGGTGLSTVGSENDVLKISNGVPVYGNTPNVPKNYITATDGKIIGAWTTYADAAGTYPVDGTGGTSTATFAVSTDLSLRGTTNFLFTHTAANNQGNGFSYDFTIDPSDKGKVLQISLEYLIASGTYADDDLQFWVYYIDGANSRLIQPAPFKLKNSGIPERFPLEFQTQGGSSATTTYRLIGHVATSTATAYTIRFDNFNVGPQAKLYGSAQTDWVSYTPTFTGFGSPSAIDIQWRMSGPDLLLKGTFVSGASTNTEARISLPSGMTSVVSTSSLRTAGEYYKGVSSTTHGGSIFVESALGYITFGESGTYGGSTINSVVKANADTIISSGNIFTFTATVPIAGWSSSRVMSNDADTRVVNFVGYVNGTPTLTAATTNLALTTLKDSHSSWVTNIYTVKVPGDYLVTGTAYSTATAGNLQAYKNGSIFSYLMEIKSGSPTNGSSRLPDLKAGDTISIRSDTTLTVNGSLSNFSITRDSGPSQIMASESVSFSANTSTTAATTSAPFIYTVKDHDTHNAYSTTTGEFTAPVSGKYDCNISAYSASSFAVNLHKNGTAVYQGGYDNAGANVASGSHTLSLLSGDTLEVRPSTSVTASGGAINNNFSCHREGN